MKKLFAILTCTSILLFACSKEESLTTPEETTPTPSGPNLVFKIHLDSTLARLDNFGNPCSNASWKCWTTP